MSRKKTTASLSGKQPLYLYNVSINSYAFSIKESILCLSSFKHAIRISKDAFTCGAGASISPVISFIVNPSS